MTILVAAAALLACTGAPAETPAGSAPCPERKPAASDWRQQATSIDRDRLRRWRDAWQDALTKIRANGGERELVGYGPLLQSDVASTGPVPPIGTYACRVVKLGARIEGAPQIVTYPPFRCTIAPEGDALRFTKTTGSQRPTGLILPDDDQRAVFLGTLVLGDERMPLRYGQDAARDMIGVVQRIGERRWRLVLPYPAFESTIDVIELTPS
ncbi:DUF4893 domain-containing protein [Sphingomonas sp. RS2018]